MQNIFIENFHLKEDWKVSLDLSATVQLRSDRNRSACPMGGGRSEVDRLFPIQIVGSILHSHLW